MSSIAVEKPTNVRYGVLGFACVLSMITYLDRVCFGTVASNIQTEFGLSEIEKGWLFTAFAFAYAVFEVPTGWLGDIFGARNTLIRIVLWWSVFTVLTGTIYPTPGSSIAFCCCWRSASCSASARPARIRTSHGRFITGSRSRSAASPRGPSGWRDVSRAALPPFLVYALMYETVTADGVVIHWRHMFYVFGGLGVVWCGLWWWWYRDNPAEKAGVNAAEIALIQQRRHASTPTSWWSPGASCSPARTCGSSA